MSDDEGVGGDPSDFEEGDGADASDPDERVEAENEAEAADDGGRTAAADDVEPMDVETADPEEVERLRRRVEAFEESIEERTVHRDEVEGDLKRYVRRKLRRGHARGWGPYLVLLYGTLMTLGAFYFLHGVWAILAMLVVCRRWGCTP